MAKSDYLPLSCFGKLPFYREYLEERLATPSLRQLKTWVREGRSAAAEDLDNKAAAAADSSRVDVRETRRLRLLVASPRSVELTAAVLRPSEDLQHRAHPFFVGVSFSRRLFGKRPPLVPLALVDLFEALGDAWTSLEGAGSREAFREMLPSYSVRPPLGPTTVEAAFKSALDRPLAELFAGDDGGAERVEQALRVGLPRLVRQLKERPDDTHVAELPAPSRGREAALAASLWLHVVNRQFIWRRHEPLVCIDEGSDGPGRVVLVFGRLRPRDYGWMLGCHEELVHTGAGPEASRAPGEGGTEVPATLGELVRSRLR